MRSLCEPNLPLPPPRARVPRGIDTNKRRRTNLIALSETMENRTDRGEHASGGHRGSVNNQHSANAHRDNNENENENGNGDDNGEVDPVEPLSDHENAAFSHPIDAAELQTTRTCGVEPLANLQVIPVRMCRTADYLLNPKTCERKGAVGMMVSLRTSVGSGKATVVNTGGARYNTGAGANSRYRLASNLTTTNYDRIVTFADCSSSTGECFAYMSHTKTQSVNFFENLRVGQEGIGNLVLLEEIYPVGDTLGSSTNVALIKRCSHVLPLTGNVATLVPSVQIGAPIKGDTRFFCQHRVKVVEFGHASIQPAVCGGELWYV